MISLPWRAYGIASFWMSVGLLNFMVVQASQRGAMIPRSAKETGGEVSSPSTTETSFSLSEEVLEAASSFPSGAGEPEGEEEVEASSGEGMVEEEVGG